MCSNCDGLKCMACAYRREHERCEDDCPECCGTPLWDDQDDYREEVEFGY